MKSTLYAACLILLLLGIGCAGQPAEESPAGGGQEPEVEHTGDVETQPPQTPSPEETISTEDFESGELPAGGTSP
jgi:hypothetical protein